MPERRLHPFMLGFVSTNFRRRIDLRFLTGGGITYQIVRGEREWFKVSLSGEYEQTDFATNDYNRDQYDSNREINTLRGTVWISGKYRFLDNRVIFNHESYYQPSLAQRNNYRWRTDLGIELPIRTFMNLAVNYRRNF